MTVTSTPNNAVQQSRGQSQWSVAWKQLKKNPLARFGGACLLLLYLMALFAPFLAPDGLSSYSTTTTTRYRPPTPLKWSDPEGKVRGPYVEQVTQQMNPDTFAMEMKPTGEKCPLKFFVKGEPYKLFGFIPGDVHLYGTGNPDCKFFLMGTEGLGRDLFTRILYASQISLTIGVASVLISTILGLTLGAIAAFFGGTADTLIMRAVEVLAAIPGLFLLLLLRSIFPQNINPILALYVVLGLLAFISWGGLARTTRSVLMSERERDYVSAAHALGASNSRIMIRHMLPTMTTLVIIGISLGIPGAIIGESGLSFLGIGAVEPYVSWGSLLAQTQEGGIASMDQRPWMLIPGLFIVFTIMCWQLLGDGLRDAFDPRKRR